MAKYENEYANLSEPEQFGVVVSTRIHAGTHAQTNKLYATHFLVAHRYHKNDASLVVVFLLTEDIFDSLHMSSMKVELQCTRIIKK